MLFERKVHATKEISTSSLPDIIFLLLVFFMVVTVMKTFDSPKIDMPRAHQIKKLENRRTTAFIWATKDGFTVLNDIKFSNLLKNAGEADLFKKYVKQKMEQTNKKLIISLKADTKSKMLLISNIHKLLKDDEVGAYRISYSALKKSE